MPVGRARPGGAALAEPGPQGPVGELAEPLPVPADGDVAVGQVQVVQGEVADRGPAGGVDRGQGNDQPLRAGLVAACSTARISASVIGSRLPPGSAAVSRAAGLAKIKSESLGRQSHVARRADPTGTDDAVPYEWPTPPRPSPRSRRPAPRACTAYRPRAFPNPTTRARPCTRVSRAQRIPQPAAPPPPVRAAPATPAVDTSGWGSSAPPPLSRGLESITRIPPVTIIPPVPPVPPPRSVTRGPSTPRAALPDPGRDAAAAIRRSLSNRPFAGGAGDELLPTNPGTEDQVRQRLPDRDCDHFETEAGFVIRGVRVLDAVAARGAAATARLLDPGDGRAPAVVQLADGAGQRLSSPTSVALVLDGRRCVILPGLPGYIAHATVSAAGLSTVSYVPSSNTWRWPYYVAHRDDVDRLRATVTLAVEFNRFQVDSNRERMPWRASAGVTSASCSSRST